MGIESVKIRNVNMTLAEIVSAHPHVALSAIRKVHPEWLSAEYRTPKSKELGTTNGLTKSVWAEYVEHSGEEVFAITHAIYNPSYVEWLESELRAARQNTKVAEQTPTNSGKPPCCEDCGATADLVVKCESCFEKYRR